MTPTKKFLCMVEVIIWTHFINVIIKAASLFRMIFETFGEVKSDSSAHITQFKHTYFLFGLTCQHLPESTWTVYISVNLTCCILFSGNATPSLKNMSTLT